ncbi:MAG TPA: phosphate ABC transporter ATP-binding protein [Bellilinea sp.]|nr:phosphate ABC transporter ATP-binding protein [Bellilinea sp.]
MGAIVQIRDVSLRYSDGMESLSHITLNIVEHAVNVLFGPSGGGKSSLLRMLDRLNDLADVAEVEGEILYRGQNILNSNTDVIDLRRRVGMVFSRPAPLPLTVYENIAYGLRLMGEKRKSVLDDRVEQALRLAVLWDEVYDRLNDPGNAISGGQQQRLCLARVLALEPEIIMLDEPTSALDPVSTAKIESLIDDLTDKFTIILAPHNVQQAARTADYAAFFLQGKLVEYGEGKTLFVNPQRKETQDYVTGRFG